MPDISLKRAYEKGLAQERDEQMRQPKGTAVDGPAHYRGYRVLEIINEFGLGFELGNVVKYVLRAGVKAGESDVRALEKARFYLDWYIKRLKRGQDLSGQESNDGKISGQSE